MANILGQGGDRTSRAAAPAPKWGTTLLVGLPATAVALVVAGAALGAAPRIYPPLGRIVPKVAPVERLIAWGHEHAVHGHNLGVRLVILIGLFLLALLAVSKALDLLETWPLIQQSTPVRRILAVLACVVLGLFAARARMETCGSFGSVIDCALNGVALGLGAACGAVAAYLRSLE